MKTVLGIQFYCVFLVAAVSTQFLPDGPVYVNPNAPATFDQTQVPEPGAKVTQTVYGFLDFTTTIGNTVMVFSPQSAAAQKKPEVTTEVNVIQTKATTPKPTTTEIKPSKTVEERTEKIILKPSKAQEKQVLSSKVEIKESPPKKSAVLSSKVEIISNQKPVVSSVVKVLTNVKEDAAEIEANNIDKPEYDFLNRQPSAIVDETYKVIDIKSSSKFHLKPKTRATVTPKDRATGLVTKMGGTVVKDGVTTVHETQVIGTYISGKYAQVLQSTAKILPKEQKIAPTATARILKTAAPSLPKNRAQLEPTPAGSLHEETALPLEALFHGEKSLVRPSRRLGPAAGGPPSGRGANEFKSKYKPRQDEIEDDQEEEPVYKRSKFRPSSVSTSKSFRYGKSTSIPQVATVSVYSEPSTVTPSGGKKYQNSNRRNNGATNSFKAKSIGKDSHEETGARRSFKSKIQATPAESGSSTSLHKFKLQRPAGRWQYKTTPKPRVTIRGRESETNEVVPVSPSTQTENDLDLRRDDLEVDVTALEPSTVAPSTIKVSISTPADFSDVYYEIATVKSPYVFQAGTVKNTRFITVTTTVEKTLQSVEPSPTVLPISATLTEPLTENILATAAPVYDKEVPLDSSIATLPPIALGTDVETPPLETLTETFSTTQMLLKTHILPVIRGGTDTTSYTLVQSYHVTRLVTATKTLPPMEVYQFVPSKTLNEFNTRLDEAGSELHLELDFADENQKDDDDSPPGIRALPPDLDLANIGNEFDVSSVDQNKLVEAIRQAKAMQKATTPKPTTESPTTPALPPDQIQQLALLRLLNPNANIPQFLTSSKPVVKLETIYESHVIPLINGQSTSFSTLTRPVATVSKTEYELVTNTLTPQIPPLNPLLPLQPQFTISSTPIVTNTIVTATESKVLKLTFGAKTAYTTLYSTRVVPTVLTTYLTNNVPVLPTAAAFPGFFPAPYGGFPPFG